MKNIYLLTVAIILSFTIKAQMLPRMTIASAGGFSTHGGLSFSYTVAEATMINTFTGRNNILTQGFQQPENGGEKTLTTEIALVERHQEARGSLVVYPVPAVDNLSYSFIFPGQGQVAVTLYNERGQKVSDVYDANYDNGKTIEQLNVSSLPAGVYYLSMNFTRNSDSRVETINKKIQIIK